MRAEISAWHDSIETSGIIDNCGTASWTHLYSAFLVARAAHSLHSWNIRTKHPFHDVAVAAADISRNPDWRTKVKTPFMTCLWVISSSYCIADDASLSRDSAIATLENVETVRSQSKPFRISGVLRRQEPARTWEFRFTAEVDGNKYRIRHGANGRSVAIFDGTRLLYFDGDDSAIVTSLEHHAAGCFAFNPTTLGISSYLDPSYTLSECAAYRYASDVKTVKDDPSGSPDARHIQLIDRFGQLINFAIIPQHPFRVVRYSKTIPIVDGPPLSKGGQVFSMIVVESSFWPDDDTSWIPRSIETYTLDRGDPESVYSREEIKLDKPEWIENFSPETFTVAGLSMSVGIPVADIVSKRRIGYWNGNGLSAELPVTNAE